MYVGRQRKVRSFPSNHYNSCVANRFAIILVFDLFLQQFFMQEERERNEVAMYETVNDPSHTPAPYEEVREVKRSQDIQLTSNEAYGPILRENIQTTPNTAYGQVHL